MTSNRLEDIVCSVAREFKDRNYEPRSYPMKDDPRIACGYGPFTVPAEDFIDACRWHDQSYLKDSWHQGKLTRKQVDQWFRDQMLLIAGKSRVKRALAWGMYGVTRMFGGLFWEGKK